jgi:Rrf2 family protein
MTLAKQIADRQHVPMTYLEHILASLRRAELVSATRGAAGGYRLSRPPEHIDLSEAIAALEGPLILSDCAGDNGCCGQIPTCSLPAVFRDAADAMNEVLRGVTLADLVSREQELACEPMWFI